MKGIPERVLSLIEASGLSRGDFARRIGLDDSKLSKSLSGARRFSSLDLARIAEECDVTVDWLITGEEPPLAMAARTTGGEAGTALERPSGTARCAATWRRWAIRSRGSRSRSAAGAEVRRAGSAAGGRRSRAFSEAGRSVAEADLPALVEEVFGADVAVIELDEGFDGLAASSADAKLIVLATSRVPWRQRFTLAHELGHLLAGDDQEVHLDRDVFDKAQARDPSETRANASRPPS